jgi:hypothetical protein
MMVEVFLVEDWAIAGFYLAIAPTSTYIKEGDLVLMEGEGQGFRRASCDSVLMSEDGADFKMLKMLAKDKVLKAIGKYRLKEFDWEEVEENE